MAKIPGDIFHPRRGSGLRGSHYVYEGRAGTVVARWPRKRGAAKSPAQAQAQTDFAAACWIIKNMDALAQELSTAVAAGAPLLPRDVLMWQLFNKAFYFVMPDGRKVFSMAAMQDVSLLLDALAQLKGDLLTRGDDWWQPLRPDDPTQALTLVWDPILKAPKWGTPPVVGTIGARLARNNGTQSLTSGAVTFDATDYADPGFVLNAAAGSITVPTDGDYAFSGHIRLNSGSTPTFSFLYIARNTTFTGIATNRDNSQSTDMGLSGTYRCNAGDVMQLNFNSGGSGIVISNNGVVAQSVWFSATRL